MVELYQHEVNYRLWEFSSETRWRNCLENKIKRKNTNMTDSATLRPGVYRHYKGKDYEVVGTATHSESGEILVVYRCLYGDYDLWVRPLVMFQETVEVNGEIIPRFAYCGDKEATQAV